MIGGELLSNYVFCVGFTAVDFFNQVNLLYGTLTEFCTVENCPTMSAGPKYASWNTFLLQTLFNKYLTNFDNIVQPFFNTWCPFQCPFLDPRLIRHHSNMWCSIKTNIRIRPTYPRWSEGRPLYQWLWSLQWLTQLVFVTIWSYAVLYLINENVIYVYQAKSFMFYNVWTIYWTSSENWTPK